MKKIIFLFCFIILFACSKSEDVPLVPDTSVEVSHITNDDLILVDGLIQLKISKEEAVSRGVPASEYDLVKETLFRHNKGKTITKSTNSCTLAWGILEDPAIFHSNSAGPLNVFQSLEEGGCIHPFSLL